MPRGELELNIGEEHKLRTTRMPIRDFLTAVRDVEMTVSPPMPSSEQGRWGWAVHIFDTRSALRRVPV
jgi:hypothetical protein